VVEQARTAYYLAVAYRELKQLETADYYLEQAAGLYADTNYIWQYMGITYEYGVHYYLEGDYDASLQWLEMTWAETQKLDDTHRHQRVLHCLGIVMGMFRHRLKEARGYLEQALKIAQHDHNDYDVAHIRHSLAFNTARSGDLAAARSEIEYGMQLAEAVTADHRRTRLKKVYGELLQMIENNDPRLRD
jgi:tetratricopeptide (TPR) repeat protein